MEAVNDGLKAFADPSFQLLLVEAQKAAAATERSVNYDLLSELLVHRIEKGNDRHIRTGIHKAVEIIEDISDEALLGLTIVHSVNTFMPIASDIKVALDMLDKLFGKIMYAELPQDIDWIDQLDVLDAIRINQLGKFKTIKEYYVNSLKGLLELGIRKESEGYYKVQEILAERKLPFSLIMNENSLNSNYVRVNVNGIESVDSLCFVQNINGTSLNIPFTLEQKNAVKSVFKLYSNDSKIKQELNNAFIEEWNKHTNLFKLKEWWEKLPYSFSVTSVGKVLAHANAQRCEKSLPPLN